MTISIAVDAMGGDFGPPVTVPASVQALSFYPSLNIILVGDEKKIKAELDLLSFSDFSMYFSLLLLNDQRLELS